MGLRLRADGRRWNQLRPVTIEPGYLKFAPGSVLIRAGDTCVLCAASIAPEVPDFLEGKGRGWLTAEYSMLPASTPARRPREAFGKSDGRTQEIRRLIGRALRPAVDLESIGERTIWLDCDVIQADGGTRTLAVTGAWIALAMALQRLRPELGLRRNPLRRQICAVSVGIVEGQPMLDLTYVEDSSADVDMNVVMARPGTFVEIQGTAENNPFDDMSLRRMLALARSGCSRLMCIQRAALRKAVRIAP